MSTAIIRIVETRDGLTITVEVDHGDTDCKTPDATQYILKTAARMKAKT